MRAWWNVSVVLIAIAASIACGSDDEEEPQGDPDGGEIAPAPGVCHSLCCSDSDCASGESCTAFATAAGTLGTCSGTGSGSWSTATVPSGCWTLNTPTCDLISNDQCDSPDVCGYHASTDPELPPNISCAGGDNSRTVGQNCDAVRGPWCALGLHCVPNE